MAVGSTNAGVDSKVLVGNCIGSGEREGVHALSINDINKKANIEGLINFFIYTAPY